MREINETIRYSMWSVFASRTPWGTGPRRAPPDELGPFSARSRAKVSSCAASTTWPVCAPTPTSWSGGTPRPPTSCRSLPPLPAHRLGRASSRCGRRWRCTVRRSSTRATSRRSWPTRSRGYVCVYPFVRSYEWYLLPTRSAATLLAEHGQMARDYPDVRANTVASFALGDYEWLLAFEADELHRIVDLMRHLRARARAATCARRSRSTPGRRRRRRAGRRPAS